MPAELTNEESQIADYLHRHVADDDPQTLSRQLNVLSDSMTADDVRAIEFHPDVTEWMCAIQNWIAYLTSGDPKAIAGIAVNMVNSIDYAIGGDTAEYSIHNILGSPLMQAEYERQKQLLVADDASA